MPRIAPLRRPDPWERTRWQRLPARLRSALVLAIGVSTFLVLAVSFVEFIQPAVKRLVAEWIDHLGGTRSTALGLGAAICAAAFASTWFAISRWRHVSWRARVVLLTSSSLSVLLALGMAPQSRISDDAHHQTLEAVGDDQTAVLVDAATDAMLLTLLALGACLYLSRRLRSGPLTN